MGSLIRVMLSPPPADPFFHRASLHTDWVFGRVGNTVRFLSAIVLMELRLGADTPRHKRAVDQLQNAFPSGRPSY